MTITPQQGRVLIGAVAAFIVTVIPILPIDPQLQTIVIGLVTAIAGYLIPKGSTLAPVEEPLEAPYIPGEDREGNG